MLVILIFAIIHGFVLDSVFLEEEADCSGVETQNLFIQLVLPCELWESDLEIGGGTEENFYLVWSSNPETGTVWTGDSADLYDRFRIGQELEEIEHISPGERWIIAGDLDTTDPILEAEADEITNWLFFDILEEYRYLLLVWEDEEGEGHVVDTFDLQTLDDGSFLAKRNYAFFNAEYDDAVEDCEGDVICEEEVAWGETNPLWPGYIANSWDHRAPADCRVQDDLEFSADSCESGEEEEEEGEVTEGPVVGGETSSPTLAPTLTPTIHPTANPVGESSQANTSESNGGSNSTSFTSQIWFFIILFVAGMALCGFFMKFCRRTSSVDDGFIAAADYEEGVHGEQRSSLIMMQPVKKGVAMMDGENAHFDEDGLGDTPSASRVRESRIIRQREGESDHVEGLPTGHQVIKASSISGSERSRDSKRSPGSSEVGEIDISSLE